MQESLKGKVRIVFTQWKEPWPTLRKEPPDSVIPVALILSHRYVPEPEKE